MASVREELRRMAKQDNLSNTAVEKAARSAKSPLHNLFTWDDTVAGYRYRLIEADRLIRSYRITIAEDARGPKTTREFTSAREAGYANLPSGTYKFTEDVVLDDRALAFLLRNLKRDIAELKRRYGHLEQFAAILREAAG